MCITSHSVRLVGRSLAHNHWMSVMLTSMTQMIISHDVAAGQIDSQLLSLWFIEIWGVKHVCVFLSELNLQQLLTSWDGNAVLVGFTFGSDWWCPSCKQCSVSLKCLKTDCSWKASLDGCLHPWSNSYNLNWCNLVSLTFFFFCDILLGWCWSFQGSSLGALSNSLKPMKDEARALFQANTIQCSGAIQMSSGFSNGLLSDCCVQMISQLGTGL